MQVLFSAAILKRNLRRRKSSGQQWEVESRNLISCTITIDCNHNIWLLQILVSKSKSSSKWRRCSYYSPSTPEVVLSFVEMHGPSFTICTSCPLSHQLWKSFLPTTKTNKQHHQKEGSEGNLRCERKKPSEILLNCLELPILWFSKCRNKTSKDLVKEEFASKPTKDLANLKGLTEGRICKQNHIEGSSCKAQRIFWRKTLQTLQVKPNWRIFLQSSKDLLKEEFARRTTKGCCRKNLQARTSKGCCRKSLGEKPQSIF